MKKEILRKKMLISLVVGVLFVIVLTAVVCINNVVASDKDDREQKMLASSVITCYQNGFFKDSVTLGGVIPSKLLGSVMNKDSTIYVSYDKYNKIEMKCKDFLSGLLPSYGSAWSNDDKKGFLESLGYVLGDGNTVKSCVYFEYELANLSTPTDPAKTYTQPNQTKALKTQYICATVNSDGTYGDVTIENNNSPDDPLLPINFKYNKKKNTIDLGGIFNHNNIFLPSDWKSVGSAVYNVLNSPSYYMVTTDYDCPNGGSNCAASWKLNTAGPFSDDSKSDKLTYTIDVASASTLQKGTQFFAGSSWSKKPNFLTWEKFAVYQNYLVNYYKVSACCSLEKSEDIDYMKGLGWRETTLYSGGDYKTCYVHSDNTSLKNPGSFADFGVTSISYNSIVGALPSLASGVSLTGVASPNTSTCPVAPEEPEPNPDDPNDPDPGSPIIPGAVDKAEIFDCNSFTTVGAMQWLLCPTMNNMQYTASWLDNMTQDFLEIKTTIYNSDEIKGAWGLVRNIANGLMVLFFMIIVISQLTGYGIDNYGIKKMLPRLILIAILMNLSIYICQALVDVSNIAGTGLRNMFGGMSETMETGGVKYSSDVAGDKSYIGAAVGGIVQAAATGLPAAATVAPVAIAAFGPGVVAVIIIVIVALLAVVIAVLVLLLAIGARQVIVMFCILISPFAFVAYVLPNTQQLSKKWAGLFKAALIVFPILGALSGISLLLRTLGKGSAPWYTRLILLVLPYVGFFLIPMLLTNAISALGKVGAALTSMGNTVRSAGRNVAQGGIRAVQSTEAYKNRQAEAARRRQRDSSQRTIERLEDLKKRREAAGGKLTDDEAMRLARAHEVQRKLDTENTAAQTILAEREYAGVSQDKVVAAWKREFMAGNGGKANALANVIASKYGSGGVNAMAKEMAGDDMKIFDNSGGFVNDNMKRSFEAMQTNMMQNSSLANAMQNKASDVYQMVTSGGYGDDGNMHNLDYHSAHNNIATQDKDWATQSSATLERAMNSGALTPKTAQRILNSTDPAIQSGIKSDESKRRILERAASGYTGKSASSVYDEAMAENQLRSSGMSASYAAKTSKDVESEAWEELNVRNQKAEQQRQEINEAHGQALEEDKERTRNNTRDENIRRIGDNIEALNRNLENMNRNNGNHGQDDNNGGYGFEGGSGI